MCCRTPVCKPTPLKCALSKINDIETQRALTLSRTLALGEHDLAVDSELLAVSIFYFAFSIETFFPLKALAAAPGAVRFMRVRLAIKFSRKSIRLENVERDQECEWCVSHGRLEQAMLQCQICSDMKFAGFTVNYAWKAPHHRDTFLRFAFSLSFPRSERRKKKSKSNSRLIKKEGEESKKHEFRFCESSAEFFALCAMLH